MISIPTNPGLEALLLRLGTTPEKAGDAYNKLHASLTRYFVFHGARDGEFLADETIDRVGKEMKTGTLIKQIAPYCFRVAKNLWREVQHKLPAHVSIDQIPEPLNAPPSQEERMDRLENCLSHLKVADRNLIIAYYQQTDSRKEIAKFLSLSLKTLHNNASLLRAKLLACMKAT